MINKFLGRKEETFLGKLSLIGSGFTFMTLYVAAFIVFGFQYFQQGTIPIFGGPEMSLGQLIVRACVIAPIWEEVAFRYLPMKFFGKENLIPAVIGSSIFFGYIHGGVPNIFLQGVAGLILATVYIKSNYSLWVNVTLHALWNFFLMVILPIYVSAN
jgi:membrane protease YdiL (CAAX protease family)